MAIVSYTERETDRNESKDKVQSHLGDSDVSGHFRNRSARRSMGAVRSPTAVSNGGLSGAVGWERDGTNIFVRPKLLA